MVPTRRDALKHIAAAGIGCAASPGVVWGQDASIAIAGRPAQIAIASVSPSTVRITISPLVSGVAQNLRPSGALVEPGRPRSGQLASTFPVARAATSPSGSIPGRRHRLVPFKRARGGEPVQTLSLDAVQPTISFALGSGHVFGLGEGGPQFDRKGQVLGTRNGQGGYQLRRTRPRADPMADEHRRLGDIHPSTTGCLRPHRREGRLTPVNDALPIEFSSWHRRSQGADARIRARHRIRGAAAVMVVRLHTIAPHAGGPGQIEWVARTLREKRLPCDALIYLGTEFTPSGWNTRNGEFGWKPRTFPIRRVHRRGPRAAITRWCCTS